ncbi:hypothetical protein CHS0354_016913 [Potamilus streckersoni]|uniref:Uncharacterized protein n=1 Tax=Potamilus streckersoni TaxID=2493646 RepID=A0AAE0S733_9BIVA|nr:hypothetical protein CHS0354_016913 [Potamilus streckersoni]
MRARERRHVVVELYYLSVIYDEGVIGSMGADVEIDVGGYRGDIEPCVVYSTWVGERKRSLWLKLGKIILEALVGGALDTHGSVDQGYGEDSWYQYLDDTGQERCCNTESNTVVVECADNEYFVWMIDSTHVHTAESVYVEWSDTTHGHMSNVKIECSKSSVSNDRVVGRTRERIVVDTIRRRRYICERVSLQLSTSTVAYDTCGDTHIGTKKGRVSRGEHKVSDRRVSERELGIIEVDIAVQTYGLQREMGTTVVRGGTQKDLVQSGGQGTSVQSWDGGEKFTCCVLRVDRRDQDRVGVDIGEVKSFNGVYILCK